MANISPRPGGNDVDVTFYDNYVPHLPAAEYTITLSQRLTGADVTPSGAGGAIPESPHPPVSQRFYVAGPRFTALPRAEIHRPFPPKNGTGSYQEYLPEVAFIKRDLPWERQLDLTGNESQDAKVPWLALLVFTDGQLLVPAAPGGAPRTPTGQDLQANPAVVASLPLNQIAMPTPAHAAGPWPGPPAKIRGPRITGLDPGQSGTGTRCRVIDIASATFTELVPSTADLPFLSHVRYVKTAHKEPQPAKDDGWFSAVIANRFAVGPRPPATTARNVVHLVSLEGFEDLLAATGPQAPAGFDYVRLVSLYSWSFTCLASPQENFREMMLAFLAPYETSGTGLPLRLPLPSALPPLSTPAEQEAVHRVEAGYTALGYAMRSGEQSFAWYRGPFTPVVTRRFLATTSPGSAENAAAPRTASEAMVYSSSTGLFDQSYATAWSTGRLLALADKTFATHLLQWRRAAHGLIDLLLEQIQSPALRSRLVSDGIVDANGRLTAAGTTDLATLLDERLATDTFKDFLANELLQSIADRVARPGPFDPDRGLVGTVKGAAASPSDLSRLMSDPAVVALLRQRSGLVPVGRTKDALTGSVVTGIALAGPGAAEPIGEGAQLTLTSPDGSAVAVVTASGAVTEGGATVPIAAYDFVTPLPAASAVTLGAGGLMPSQIVNWLAARALLYGVPFNNVVPNQAMLPAESLRFFYVDRNWTDALLDGALSAGVQSSRDSLFHQLMRDPLHRAVDGVLHQVRERLRNAPQTGTPPPIGVMAGFVMRSAVVSGWPNLEVRAWSSASPDPTNDPPMTPLRLDRVSANVLIGIFPDVPVALELNQPSEGLAFGSEDEGIDGRYLPGMTLPAGKQIGSLIEPKKTLPFAGIPRRSAGASSVITVGGAGGLVDKLQAMLDPPQSLTPASFAVEMVRSPEQLVFRNGGDHNR